MISWLAKQFRYLLGFLRTNDSPRQIALGLALGVVLGLTPKGNLLAALVASLLLAVRVNAQAGMLSAVLVSFIAHWFDPVADRIGHSLLTSSTLHPLWTQLYNLPLAPWTGFNHTLVLGSFVLGWLLFYPVYRAARPAVERWQQARHRRMAARQAQRSTTPHSVAGQSDTGQSVTGQSDTGQSDTGPSVAAQSPSAQSEQPQEHLVVSIPLASSPEAKRAREIRRRQRFREFVAEVESLSQRRGAA